VTNAAGQTTTYAPYSCTGQLASSFDPNKVTVSLAYDGASRIVQRQVTQGSLVNQVNVEYVDGPGSTITRTELATPNPSTATMYSLDGIGRVTDQSVLSDPQGPTHVSTTFNPQGEVQSVTNPYRLTSDPTYGVTNYFYDALGRKTVQTNPDNSNQYWCYDNVASNGQPNCHSNQTGGFGEWVDHADERGNDWQQTTDAFGRLTNVVELGSSSQPLNLKTNYTYDGFGNLLAVNQNGQSGDTPRQRSFTYDAFSRLVCASNPENSTAACPASYWTSVAGTTGYDYYTPSGALCAGDHTLPCSKTDARNITTYYAYDALNRLTSKTYSSNAPAGSMSSCFAYDSAATTNGIGRLASEWTQTGACSSTIPTTSGFQTERRFQAYDAMGHIQSEYQCVPNTSGQGSCTASSFNPFTLSYAYDPAGNLISYGNGVTNVPKVGTINFALQYDGAGRLSALTSNWSDTLHPPTLFTADPTNGYTAAGGIQNMILGNNIFVNKTYDNRLRPTAETATHP
jgi:YD repeat-containing protein